MSEVVVEVGGAVSGHRGLGVPVHCNGRKVEACLPSPVALPGLSHFESVGDHGLLKGSESLTVIDFGFRLPSGLGGPCARRLVPPSGTAGCPGLCPSPAPVLESAISPGSAGAFLGSSVWKPRPGHHTCLPAAGVVLAGPSGGRARVGLSESVTPRHRGSRQPPALPLTGQALPPCLP